MDGLRPKMKGFGLLLVMLSLWLTACSGDDREEARSVGVESGQGVTAIGTPEIRIDFSLRELDGELRTLSEWDGDVVLLNFWAPWCPPCVREMPAFVELQERYGEAGFTIVAVAIDDEQNVRDFIDNMLGVNFPVLMGDADGMELTRQYGNRLGALPYSVLYDRQGKIIHTHRSELHLEDAVQLIEPLI